MIVDGPDIFKVLNCQFNSEHTQRCIFLRVREKEIGYNDQRRISVQFSAKIMTNNRLAPPPSGVGATLWEIMDPPLNDVWVWNLNWRSAIAAIQDFPTGVPIYYFVKISQKLHEHFYNVDLSLYWWHSFLQCVLYFPPDAVLLHTLGCAQMSVTIPKKSNKKISDTYFDITRWYEKSLQFYNVLQKNQSKNHDHRTY